MAFAARFKNYLEKQNLSAVSIKNYLADINKFLDWIGKFGNLDFSSSNFQAYYQYLIDGQTPQPSLKRYLSSLRQFGQFLAECGETPKNPAIGLPPITQLETSANKTDIEKLLDSFEKSLIKEKLSPVTVKNYLVDVRQFLKWSHDQK